MLRNPFANAILVTTYYNNCRDRVCPTSTRVVLTMAKWLQLSAMAKRSAAMLS